LAGNKGLPKSVWVRKGIESETRRTIDTAADSERVERQQRSMRFPQKSKTVSL